MQERFVQVSPILRAIADPLGGLIRVDDSPGSDLTFMSKARVPTIASLQEARRYFDYHHSAADTFDKVRPEELRHTVGAIASLIYSLAQAD
jgi:carboxypeptidase Q